MTIKELGDLLATIHIDEQHLIPVAYDHFDESVGIKIVPPFIVFRTIETTTIKADDKVHYQENDYIVDLVVEQHNIPLETQLESLFNDNYLPYDKEESYFSNERIYQIRYFL